MLRQVLCLYGCLGLAVALGQPSGYLGYRTAIRVSASAFPALGLRLREGPPLRFNVYGDLSVERIVTRRLSAEWTLGYYRTLSAYMLRDTMSYMRLRGWYTGPALLIYPLYRRGNIAPVGPYQRIGVYLNTTHAQDLAHRFFPDGRSRLGTFGAISLAAMIGTQHVWRERIIWRIGLEAAWTLDTGALPEDRQLAYLQATTARRIRQLRGLSLVAGLGWLTH
ncbi:MAG: hypothetical protein SF053_07460 [Bacteroidia bacterium]|nr:hypothetical protein [Bacteroidia bacterium]